MRIAVVRSILVGLVGLAAAGRLQAELRRAGTEFQVNTYTPLSQLYPAVAVDSDFDFVVAWSGLGRDGDQFGVFARRFDFSGTPLATEFQVNVYTTGSQAGPSVTIAANGDFVVAWSSNAQDGSSTGVFARRFNASGTPQADEFQVNAFTQGGQSGWFSSAPYPGSGGPTVRAESNGDFVAVWHDFARDSSNSGIFARRFDAAGTAIGDDFQVNTYTTSSQFYPSVGVDGDGDFVVSWHSFGQDGEGNGIFARRFGANGSAVGGEFQVNNRTFSVQRNPNVALESNGDFVIAWQSIQDSYPASDGIFARRFTSDGAPVTVEFRVNTYTTGGQVMPRVAADADGDFVIVWHDYVLDGGFTGVFSQRFDALGAPVGIETQINTYTENPQTHSAIGMNPVGDFVIAWQGFPDGNDRGIFAQRFDNVAVLDIDANGSVTALGDGIMVLRFLFDFTGAALVDSAVDEELCQRCEAAEIEAYLATLI